MEVRPCGAMVGVMAEVLVEAGGAAAGVEAGGGEPMGTELPRGLPMWDPAGAASVPMPFIWTPLAG